MRFSLKAYTYIIKTFFHWVLACTLAFSVVILLFSMGELFRKASGVNITFPTIAKMAFFQLPSTLERLLPFIMLFSTAFSFIQLSRFSELVSFKALGYSYWQLISPILVSIFIFSISYFSLLNPLSASLYSKYDYLSNKFIKGKKDPLSILDSGVWMRQNADDGYVIIHLSRVDRSKKNSKHSTFYKFSSKDQFLWRMDAESVQFKEGGWILSKALIKRQGEDSSKVLPQHFWQTNFTLNSIEESYSNPSTLSLWELPRFIRILESAGLSTVSYEIQLNRVISLPILYFAMALFGGLCALAPHRKKGVAKLLFFSFAFGMTSFYLVNLFTSLGESQTLSPTLSAWIPVLILWCSGGLLGFYVDEKF